MAIYYKIYCIDDTNSDIEIEEINISDVPKSSIFIHYTTTERDALSPIESDMIYNTTDNEYQFYDGTTWQSMKGA